MSQWKINKIMKTQLIPVFASDWYLIYEDVYHSIKIFVFFFWFSISSVGCIPKLGLLWILQKRKRKKNQNFSDVMNGLVNMHGAYLYNQNSFSYLDCSYEWASEKCAETERKNAAKMKNNWKWFGVVESL